MATQSYTIRRGEHAQDVVQAAGSATTADTLTLNIDLASMTRGEALQLIQQLAEAVAERKWPPA